MCIESNMVSVQIWGSMRVVNESREDGKMAMVMDEPLI
jgi:hypothetical protein